MEKVQCNSCSNLRYCLQLDDEAKCLECALLDILFLLKGVADEIKTLKEVVSRRVKTRGSISSARRCVICNHVGALDLPYWENMCVFCVAYGLNLRLESIRLGIKTILQTCANCGKPAAYLWANRLPLCGRCAESVEEV